MASKRSQVTPEECGSYFYTYVELTEDLELKDALEKGMVETRSFFDRIPKDSWNYRYAEGKWTPLEILLHIIDTERIFAYRALRFARSENSDLPGFDQDEFADNSYASSRTMPDLINEYVAVRMANISLFGSFNDETLRRMGRASNNAMSVRAAGFIICGHENHHIKIIKERYLS